MKMLSLNAKLNVQMTIGWGPPSGGGGGGGGGGLGGLGGLLGRKKRELSESQRALAVAYFGGHVPQANPRANRFPGTVVTTADSPPSKDSPAVASHRPARLDTGGHQFGVSVGHNPPLADGGTNAGSTALIESEINWNFIVQCEKWEKMN